MSIEEIEEAITRLPARDVARLMAWLAEYHAQLWDRQIEEDLEAGRLAGVLSAVDEEYRGLAKPQAPKPIGPALDRFIGTWTPEQEAEVLAAVQIFEQVDESFWA